MASASLVSCTTRSHARNGVLLTRFDKVSHMGGAQIAMHYIKGWFFLDMLSVFPSIFDIIPIVSGGTVSAFLMLPRKLQTPCPPFSEGSPSSSPATAVCIVENSQKVSARVPWTASPAT